MFYLLLYFLIILLSLFIITFKEYNNNIKLLNNKLNKITTQRNIIGLGGIISILSLIIFIK